MSIKSLSLASWCNYADQIGAPYSGFMDMSRADRESYTSNLRKIGKHISDEMQKVWLSVSALLEKMDDGDKFSFFMEHPVLAEPINRTEVFIELSLIADYFKRSPNFHVDPDDESLFFLMAEMAQIRVSLRYWKRFLSDSFVLETPGARQLIDGFSELS